MITAEKPPLDDNLLMHYGVKGMKWGERRQLKKQASAAKAAYGRVGQAAINFSQREISEAEYKSLSSKPIRIAGANGTFNRVVKSNDAKLRDGMVYVTRDAQDHTNYIAMFPPEGNDRNRSKFSATIKTSEAVVSPALKERVDTFVGTLGKQIPDPKGTSTITGREFLTGSKREDEHPEIRALGDRELGLKYYQSWVQQQHQNDAFNQTYTNTLRKRGYNAIIDDADAGMMSQVPIILFPKEAGARITEITPITKDDELIAKANMRAPEQRNQ